MSSGRVAAGAHHRVDSGVRRVVRAWRALPAERRVAAYAAAGLFVTLFLPWYQETVIVPVGAKLPTTVSATVTGWGAFSFVEAAVLLVALGVLALLFQRAEGRAFHLPGGDGWVISAAGFWCCVLVVWRIFDKQSTTIDGPGAAVSGIEWGIFVALAVAASLAYAGTRIGAARQPEPPLPGPRRRPGEPALFGEPPLPDVPPASGQPPAQRARPPRPVFAAEPPTMRISRTSRDDGPAPGHARERRRDSPADLDHGASEAATRVRRPVAPDEQFTIPFDREDG